MSEAIARFLQWDLAALATATLCSVACALLGTFMLLRRQALMGDAISHAVLPGLAAAFLLSQSRDPWPMFVGAACAGVLAALGSELVRRYARVEPGAAMGVVFSTMFAAGIVMMSMPAMRLVDLDADCVLSGVLESIVWVGDTASGSRGPTTLESLLSIDVLRAMPRQMVTAGAVLLLVVAVIVVIYKELRIACFDPALAAALGFRPAIIGVVLMVLLALASVAAFEAVGSILVVAMLVCPPAGARMLTDRLGVQLVLAATLALMSSVGGYFAATIGPELVGWSQSVSAAGTMSVVSGLLLGACIIAAPRHGVIAGALRRVRLSVDIAREDLLAMLFRLEESGSSSVITTPQARAAIGGGMTARLAARAALVRGEIGRAGSGLMLSDTGRRLAGQLVRTHRLWEVYLVQTLGLRPDHVHRTAMHLEHLTTPEMVGELQRNAPVQDPHGKRIPAP